MPSATPTWLPDDLLDNEQRALLLYYLTPRRDLDGALLWPLDELGVQS